MNKNCQLGAVRIAAVLGVVGIALLLGWMHSAAAQTQSSTSGPLRIGIVDVQDITDRSSTVQAAVKKADASVKGMQDKIDARMKEVDQMSKDLAAQRSVLSDEQVIAQQKKIRDANDDIDSMNQQVNSELRRVRNEVMDPEVKRIMKTVADVSKREGFDLVVRSEAVLYSTERVDLTPLVIQALDKQGATIVPAATPGTKPAMPSTIGGGRATPAPADPNAKKTGGK